MMFFDKAYELGNIDSIEDVYLFGSSARGDTDLYSDVDILVVVNCETDKVTFDLKEEIADILKVNLNGISIYSESAIKKMQEYGSYFLWHIKLEGILLYTRSNILGIYLQGLPKYKKVSSDLSQYEIIVQDVYTSIVTNDADYIFELSLLASVVRNTCIAILYINDIIDFGRVSAVINTRKLMNIEDLFSVDEYIDLYKFRIYYTRGVNPEETVLKKANLEYAKQWVEICHRLLLVARDTEKRNEHA